MRIFEIITFICYALLTYVTFIADVSEATLNVTPKNDSVTVCRGKSVPLEVEIAESTGPITVTWTHGYDAVDDPNHYMTEKEGKVLIIRNILPSFSGVYYANVVDSTGSSAVVRITVDVKDIHMRFLVRSPVKIPLYGNGTLAVSKSKEGVLSWFHRGRLIRTDEHYRLMATQDPTLSMLGIYNAGYTQGGMYEVVLKSGACEIRNMIFVDIIRDRYPVSAASSSAGWPVSSVLRIITIGVFVKASVLLVGLLVLYWRKKKKEKEKKEKDTKLPEGTLTAIVMDDPVYSTIEETVLSQEHVYGNLNEPLYESLSGIYGDTKYPW